MERLPGKVQLNLYSEEFFYVLSMLKNEQLTYKRGMAGPILLHGQLTMSSTFTKARAVFTALHKCCTACSVCTEKKKVSQTKPSRPRHIRHRIETECENKAEKDVSLFVRDSSSGAHTIDNGTLLNAMFDIVERCWTSFSLARCVQ